VGAASAYPFPTVRLTALGVAAGTITSLLATWSALSAAQQQILGAQWEAMDNADFLVSIGGSSFPGLTPPVPNTLAGLADVAVSGVTDGQVMIYSAAAGKWIPGTVGPSELAYAQNITGTVTVLPNSGVVVPVQGSGISVPPSARPVYIDFGAYPLTTAAGAYCMVVTLCETTSGSSVPLLNALTTVDGIAATYPANLSGSLRLGPTTSARTFSLTAQVLPIGGSTAAAELVNATNAPTSILARAM
jgi:hypothetical protein